PRMASNPRSCIAAPRPPASTSARSRICFSRIEAGAAPARRPPRAPSAGPAPSAPSRSCAFPHQTAPPQSLPRPGSCALARLRCDYRNGRSRPGSPGCHVAGGDLGSARSAAKKFIAVRKTAKALDDVVMQMRVTQLFGIAEFGEQHQREFLVVEILAVLDGHVEEAALVLRKLFVEAAIDGGLGYREEM